MALYSWSCLEGKELSMMAGSTNTDTGTVQNSALVLGEGDLCFSPMALGICLIWDIFSYSEWEFTKETASLLLQVPCPSSSTVALMVRAQQIRGSSCLFSVQQFYSSGQFLNSQLWRCNFLDIHYKCVCMREKWKENREYFFSGNTIMPLPLKKGKYMMFISHGCCKCPILCTM